MRVEADDTLRQRRGAPLEPTPGRRAELSWKDKVADKANSLWCSVGNGIFKSTPLVLFVIALLFVCEGVSLMVREPYPDLHELELGASGYIMLHKEPFDEHRDVAVVLYNDTIGGHPEFISDAWNADKRHRIFVTSVDCTVHPKACSPEHLHLEKGYLPELPEDLDIDEEPEILFYHRHVPVDSYQEALKVGEVARPTPGRRVERTYAILQWLDLASSRAEERHAVRQKAEREFQRNYRDPYHDGPPMGFREDENGKYVEDINPDDPYGLDHDHYMQRSSMPRYPR